MVDEEAEDPLAILGVLLGIEDVLMPELIDRLAGYDRTVRVPEFEDEKLLVAPLGFIGLFERPSSAFFPVHDLDLDGIEIEGLDGP